MTESEVRITPLPPEKETPERNALKAWEKVFLYAEALTKAQTHHGRTRSLAERAERAQMLRELGQRDITKEKRDEIHERKMVLDEIGDQYAKQSEISVTLPGLGEQKARMVHLTPSERTPKKEGEKRRHWVVIAGASNDIDCVGSLVREMVARGDEVTVIGYPESFLGHVSAEFIDAVKTARTYEPHAAFYKAAIEKVMGGEDFHLVGYSNGGPIAELMLSDPKFGQHVENAVILCPASSVTQNLAEFALGCLNEAKTIIRQFRSLPRYTFSSGVANIYGPNEPDPEAVSSAYATQLSRRDKVFGALLRRILYKIPLWPKARVKPGGQVIIAAAKNDMMTKAIREFNHQTEPELRKVNNQVRVVELSGSHATVLVKPAEFIDSINHILGG